MVILLAEDDVGLRFIWNLLRTDGFTVLRAGDGEAALELSRKHPGPVDILLTDMKMPRMNGPELCRILAAERPGIKVLMMSGDSWGKEQASMNGLPFLQKPFTRTALQDCIESDARSSPTLTS